jgi:hypothetical protein
MSPRLVRLVARLLVGVSLFAQAALALAACDLPQRSPTLAFAAPEAPSCHEAPVTNANLCLAHCLADDQSDGKLQICVPVLLGVPLPVALDRQGQLPSRAMRGEVLPAQPPPRIRFQTLRI